MIHVTLNLKFSQTIIPVLTKIISQSLAQGIFLQNWKKVITLPLQKDDKLGTDLTNYQPISNLTFFLEVIDKVINSGKISRPTT